MSLGGSLHHKNYFLANWDVNKAMKPTNLSTTPQWPSRLMNVKAFSQQ